MSLRRLLPLCALAAGAPFAAADVTGTLEYVDREFTFGAGFTGVDPNVAAPKAAVRVLDANTLAVLGAAFTAEDGSFSIPLAGSGPQDVIVRAYSVSAAYGANRIVVQDLSGNVYSTSSPTLSIPDVSVDFDAGTIVAPKVSAMGAVGGPFNILHRCVQSMDYITAQGAGGLPLEMVVLWPEVGGSFASNNEVHVSSDDGFDDVVILHEAGHVIHNLYSDSDSPGGAHSFTQSDQHPSLSLGEGWASFFAGAVRQFHGDSNPGFYMDCDGDGSTGQFTIQLRMRFEDGFPYAAASEGEADEGAVFCALWDLVDRVDTDDGFVGDDDPIDGTFDLAPGLDLDAIHWQVFTGPNVTSAAWLHVVDFWDGYFEDAGAQFVGELTDAMSGWDINVFPDALEPDGGASGATTIVPSSNWGATRTLYDPQSPVGAPGNGDIDAYEIALDQGFVYSFETRYPFGNPDAGTYADTLIEVFDPQGNSVALDTDSGTGRNAKIAEFSPVSSGVHRIEVSAQFTSRPTGSYDFRADQVGVIGPPVITSVSPSVVNSVEPSWTPPIVVSGSQFANATSVTIAGAPCEFYEQIDGSLAVTLPLIQVVGLVNLVVTTPLGSDATTVTVQEPSPPVLNLNNGLATWITGDLIEGKVGAGPNDIAWLFMSLAVGPTNVPGLLDLDIGGGLVTNLFVAETFFLGTGGSAGFDFYAAQLPVGVQLYFQAGVLDSDTFALPLNSSNFAQGKRLF